MCNHTDTDTLYLHATMNCIECLQYMVGGVSGATASICNTCAHFSIGSAEN